MIKIKEGDVLEGQIIFSTNGNASLVTDDYDVFIYKKQTLNSLHLDKVKIEIFKGEKKLEGKVIEVLSRFKTEFVGKVHINKNLIFVIPDSNKIPVDFYIKGDSIAKNGQKVLIELIEWKPGSKSPKAKISKILGNSGENETEMNSIMYEYGLPIEFPIEVEKEANLIKEDIEGEISKRKDLRNITTIGIDPFDSKDADDTISFEKKDGYNLISVNIADVSHYVKPNSLLDKEAYSRGTSVYLVDRCVPMLPHILSNGICSLKSGKDKLCFTVTFKMNDNGEIVDTWFGKTIINVNKDYSYEQAQHVIENGISEEFKETDSIVLNLDRLARLIRKKRISDGSIEMGGIEVKFELANDNKKPIGVYFKEQKESNKLIEEYMLLANKYVAKLLKSKDVNYINRVHGKPDDEKLLEVKKIAEGFGYDLKIDDPNTTKQNINDLLKLIKDKPENNIISTLVIRSQKKAIYSTDMKTGHYGLGFDGGEYSHFTSPIRRYSDLIFHRILSDFI